MLETVNAQKRARYPQGFGFEPDLPDLLTGIYAIAIAIALGHYHSCIIVTGGGVKCWGHNGAGQLGIGSTGDRYSPTDVPGIDVC